MGLDDDNVVYFVLDVSYELDLFIEFMFNGVEFIDICKLGL